MEKKPFRFWVRCPKCSKSFGVPPLYVLKFLNRGAKENNEELNKALDELKKEQSGSES